MSNTYSKKVINLLIVGQTNGLVHLFAFGVLPCGIIDVFGDLGLNADAMRIVDARMSGDFRQLLVTVLHTESRRLELVTYVNDPLKQHLWPLLQLAAKHGHILNTMLYIDDIIQCISEAWETALLEMDNMLDKYANAHPDGSVSADFLDLLVYGNPSEELEEFLTRDLTEKGLKKLGNSIEISYSTIQKLVIKPLHSGILNVCYHLNAIKGMARNTYYYRPLLGSASNAALAAGGAFLIKSLELQQTIEQSTRDYKLFWCWLYGVVVRLMEETVPEDIAAFSQQDIIYLADFLNSFDAPDAGETFSFSSEEDEEGDTDEEDIDGEELPHAGSATMSRVPKMSRLPSEKTMNAARESTAKAIATSSGINIADVQTDSSVNAQLTATPTSCTLTTVAAPSTEEPITNPDPEIAAAIKPSPARTKKRFNLERVGQYLQQEPLPIPSTVDLTQKWHQLLEENVCLKQCDLIYPHDRACSLVQQHALLKRHIDELFGLPERLIGGQFVRSTRIDCAHNISPTTEQKQLHRRLAHINNTPLACSWTATLCSPDECIIVESPLAAGAQQRLVRLSWLGGAQTATAAAAFVGYGPVLEFRDIAFYNEEWMAMLLFNAAVAPGEPATNCWLMFNVRTVRDQMRSAEEALHAAPLSMYECADVTLMRRIEHGDLWRMAVSGSRKLVTVVSESGRRVRVYDTEVDEDDDEGLDASQSSAGMGDMSREEVMSEEEEDDDVDELNGGSANAIDAVQ